jgi:hypothetical protein
MQKLRLYAVCLLILFSGDNTFSQEEPERIRIMFWNVENFFDPFDDSLTMDDEFIPAGNHGWSWIRFNQKINNIYKVIISTGWKPPDIVGLCEVENRWVLERLAEITPLSKFEYKIIHKDSPDLRGIDVAILYLPNSFKPLETRFIPVTGLKPGDDPTRDILLVKGIMKSRDTVSIFVNHWPSRYPGQGETMHKRKAAASVLKQNVDSLFAADPRCKIIIMGDFNDEPRDESISEVLDGFVLIAENKLLPGKDTNSKSGLSDPDMQGLCVDSLTIGKISGDNIYCLIPQVTNSVTGTMKFEGRWFLFDQFMISGGLLKNVRLLNTGIIDHDFLLEPDEAYTGKKPFRTYNGYIYKGGYSDHLPVIMDLSFLK